MKDTIDRFIRRNYRLSNVIGFVAAIGGVVLAYLTNDTEPWGTIGGMVCGGGLLFVMYASATRAS